MLPPQGLTVVDPAEQDENAIVLACSSEHPAIAVTTQSFIRIAA
jgi:hypothetical protein